MYIERTPRGYDRSGQQVARRARFLILVSLGLERTEVTCDRCGGSREVVIDGHDPDTSRVVPCYHCIPIKCIACGGKGYNYDEKVDEHAKVCEPCKQTGYLGPSGMMVKYINHKEIRALVRKVAMHQCGHFMMGRARVFGRTLTLSGSYGGDGLTVTVPREVFDKAVPIPQELHDAWSKGEGWNDAGKEAPSMRDWALANLTKLESNKR